ncbi:alpha-ketoglutarate-dependent dioxygenase AlkB [Martelella mangrovi]|uniref:Alkylated DNA repair dioxygenase AlkB n=1 Tax=Martelella mangrovi TaxID=1397477 RepID=A0ABV2I6Y1_9HYPH
MKDLTGIASENLPSEAVFLPAFVRPDEEAALVHALDALNWSVELKRRVQHFGYRYDYRARTVTSDAYIGPLPPWLEKLGSRLHAAGFFETPPDQVIANEYLPGQGISAHVDCPPCFGDTIVSVSLLSQCEMIFRQQHGNERCSLILEPRSALVLRGPARYDWSHEIPARKSDLIGGARIARERRISLTFRKVIHTGSA